MNRYDRHKGGQAGRQRGRQISRSAGRQKGRQTDRQAGRQADRQTDGQTDKANPAHPLLKAGCKYNVQGGVDWESSGINILD
jgi:hypothetical protein